MPITFARSYVASDGKCYASLEEAQAVEMALLISECPPDLNLLPAFLITHSEKVLAILTLTDNSLPRARGVRKPRKPKATTPAQPELVRAGA